MDHLTEQLEAERSARIRAEKNAADLQRQVDILTERNEADGISLQNQMEQTRRRDLDLQKAQKELSELQMVTDSQLAGLRKKNQDIQNEFQDQFEILYKTKHKLEKERQQLKIELDDARTSLDEMAKEKAAVEKTVKHLEQSLAESHAKFNEVQRDVTELSGVKSRCLSDNSDLVRKLDELQTEINQANRVRQTLTQQVDEARNAADNEIKARSKVVSDNRALQTVIEELRRQMEEEEEKRAAVQRQLIKATNEILSLRDKVDSLEAGNQTDEVEDIKRKMAFRLQEVETQLDSTVSKAVSLEKQRSRLQLDLDAHKTELDKSHAMHVQMEKKMKQLEKANEEWRRRALELETDCNASQKECHGLVSEMYVLKSHLDETDETIELLRRDNKNLSEEIQDLTDQSSEASRKLMELEKACKRHEHDKEQLRSSLEEMESSLQLEANKVQRANIDMNNFKAEVERRIIEKDEEIENQRKAHQRALDNMQASIEVEARAKLEIIRQRKKLEQELIDLENLLEDTNNAKCEAEKSFKKFHEQIADLELVIEDEQQQNQQLKDAQVATEKKTSQLVSDIQQLRLQLEASERANKALCSDLQESSERVNELVAANAALVEAKRQQEVDLQTALSEKEDFVNELKLAEEHARKALTDSSQLAEELRQEQGQLSQFDRMKRGLEAQIKDLQTRLDESEATAMQGGKKVVLKLEQRVHDLEIELESEQHRHNETAKAMARQERRIAELGGMVEEQRMQHGKLQDIIEKLHQKLKTYKRQLDIAEETANNNLAKFRKVHQEYEEIVDRANTAESNLNQLRARNRQSSVEPRYSNTPSRTFDNNLQSKGGRLNRASSVF